MFKRILLPVDAHGTDTDAVETALDLAELTGATIHVFFVYDTRGDSTLSESGHFDIDDELSTRVDNALNQLAERCERRNIAVETDTKVGIPHQKILEYADERGIDVIVMATHGRTGLNHFLHGSTTEQVIRHADVPVLSVRILSPEDVAREE